MDKEKLDSFFDGRINYGSVGIENLSKPIRYFPKPEIPVVGYHVLSTSPMLSVHSDVKYKMRDYALYTAMLSALLWKKHNGPIHMVTDRAGYDFLKGTELFSIYDKVLPVLDERNSGISHERYWASSKVQALKMITAPCALIDMDMLVWEPLHLERYQLAGTHIEHINKKIYPPLTYFRYSPDYSFPAGWNSEAEPVNTSILYIADEEFKEYYAMQSVRFMQSEMETPDDGVVCMVFAEQRILAMCAEEKGIAAHTFLDFDTLHEPQSLVTHLWAGKQLLHCEEEAEERYNHMCLENIKELTRFRRTGGE